MWPLDTDHANSRRCNSLPLCRFGTERHRKRERVCVCVLRELKCIHTHSLCLSLCCFRLVARKGRSFILDVNILWDYPNTMPEITFRSEIFHPHFFDGGNCLGCQAKLRWSPQFSVTQALLAIRDMILEPYPREQSPDGPVSCMSR